MFLGKLCVSLNALELKKGQPEHYAAATVINKTSSLTTLGCDTFREGLKRVGWDSVIVTFTGELETGDSRPRAQSSRTHPNPP